MRRSWMNAGLFLMACKNSADTTGQNVTPKQPSQLVCTSRNDADQSNSIDNTSPYISDELGGLGLSLGSDHDRLLLLDGALHNVLGALSVLLRHLLGLHRGGVLLGEGEVRDSHVVQQDVEVRRSADQHLADLPTDELTLCE
jgi:hypothetical protein